VKRHNGKGVRGSGGNVGRNTEGVRRGGEGREGNMKEGGGWGAGTEEA